MAHSTVLSKHLYYFHFLLQGKVSLFLHVVGSHFALDVTRGDGWSLSAHALPCPAVQSRMRSVSDKAGRCVVSIDSTMASQAVSGSGLEVFEIHSYVHKRIPRIHWTMDSDHRRSFTCQARTNK